MKSVTLCFKTSPAFAEELRSLAVKLDLTVSALICQLLEKALADGGAEFLRQKFADEGYQEGLRRGLLEARTKIRDAMKGSW